MARPSKARKEETGDRLIQQYMDLEQEWDAIKQSTHKPRSLLRSGSLTDSRTMVRALQAALLDNSPRGLMCSLQQEERGWQVNMGHSDHLAVEEILRDRKAAIESGKLKGRRLFEEVEESVSENDEMGTDGRREEIMWSGLDGLVQESREVRSTCSFDSDEEKENVDHVQSADEASPAGYFCHSTCAGTCSSSSSSFVCTECTERESAVKEGGEKTVLVVVEESVDGRKRGSGIAYGERRMSLICLLAIGLLVGVISIIGSGRKFHDQGNGYKVFLVPT